MRVPDLVKFVGKGAAVPLIERALRLGANLSVEGAATKRLTASIALHEIATLNHPLWDLVEGVADIPLYEALARKFPQKETSGERHTADTVFLLGLISTDRSEEAAKFATETAFRSQVSGLMVSGSVFKQMQRQGFGLQVLAFLQGMLTRDPTLPFWDDFVPLAAQESQSGVALGLLREAMKKQI